MQRKSVCLPWCFFLGMLMAFPVSSLAEDPAKPQDSVKKGPRTRPRGVPRPSRGVGPSSRRPPGRLDGSPSRAFHEPKKNTPGANDPAHATIPPGFSNDPEVKAARQRKHLEQLKRRKERLAKNSKHLETIKQAESKQGRFVEEQRKHIRRMARIRRLIRIALENNERAKAAMARDLQRKEMNRHAKIMKEKNEHMRKIAQRKKGTAR